MTIQLDLSNEKPIELNFDLPPELNEPNATGFVTMLDMAWDTIAAQIDSLPGEGTADRYFLVRATYNQQKKVFFVHKRMCYVVGYSPKNNLKQCNIFPCNDVRYEENVNFDLQGGFYNFFAASPDDFSRAKDFMAFFAFIISEAAREESARLGVKQALFTLAGKPDLFSQIDDKTPKRLWDYRENYVNYANHSLIIVNWSKIAEKRIDQGQKVPDVYRKPVTFDEIQQYFASSFEGPKDGLINLGLADNRTAFAVV
jgi:hypothetical protein